LGNARQRRSHGNEHIVQHFTPTSSSWMNLVERLFRDFAEDAIRDANFPSVNESVEASEIYLADRNLAPK